MYIARAFEWVFHVTCGYTRVPFLHMGYIRVPCRSNDYDRRDWKPRTAARNCGMRWWCKGCFSWWRGAGVMNCVHTGCVLMVVQCLCDSPCGMAFRTHPSALTSPVDDLTPCLVHGAQWETHRRSKSQSTYITQISCLVWVQDNVRTYAPALLPTRHGDEPDAIACTHTYDRTGAVRNTLRYETTPLAFSVWFFWSKDRFNVRI